MDEVLENLHSCVNINDIVKDIDLNYFHCIFLDDYL